MCAVFAVGFSFSGCSGQAGGSSSDDEQSEEEEQDNNINPNDDDDESAQGRDASDDDEAVAGFQSGTSGFTDDYESIGFFTRTPEMVVTAPPHERVRIFYSDNLSSFIDLVL